MFRFVCYLDLKNNFQQIKKYDTFHGEKMFMN